MKVLFLDIDGPLVNHRVRLALTGPRGRMDVPDPVAITFLRRLGEQGVRIVVSSTWRKNEADCLLHMARWGLKPYLHEDWRTGEADHADLPGVHTGRGREVAEWLRAHRDVTHWVAVDDDSDFLPGQHLVLCPGMEGLTFQNYRDVLTRLGIDPLKWRDV